MSKNRNRTRLNKSVTSKEYRIKFHKIVFDYCFICAKRSGSFYGSCSPSALSSIGLHGNGRYIENHKRREYQSWKYNRKTQWVDIKHIGKP